MLELTAAQEGCGFDSQDKAFLSGIPLFSLQVLQLPSTVSRHALQTCVSVSTHAVWLVLT